MPSAEDPIIKKYHKVFKALEAFDKGKYKRSIVTNTRPKKK